MRQGVDLLRMAAGAEVKSSAAAVLRGERLVAALGWVVGQIAMHDEVGSVLDQLEAPWQD